MWILAEDNQMYNMAHYAKVHVQKDAHHEICCVIASITGGTVKLFRGTEDECIEWMAVLMTLLDGQEVVVAKKRKKKS